MLTIRDAQLHILALPAREQYIDAMLGHLYRYFPAMAWSLTLDELRHQVNRLIEHAATYRLHSQQQVCRFINLAATYGWEFDRDSGLRWMHRILADASSGEPSDRLDRLLETCLHRQRIEEHNHALAQQARQEPMVHADAPPLAQAEDYVGMECYANTALAASQGEETMTRNPLSYHLSRSLWHGLEALPAGYVHQALAWMDDLPPLLRSKTGAPLV